MNSTMLSALAIAAILLAANLIAGSDALAGNLKQEKSVWVATLTALPVTRVTPIPASPFPTAAAPIADPMEN